MRLSGAQLRELHSEGDRKFGRMAGRPTILVVDDELASRIALRKILMRAGYQLLEASSGAEALEKASAQTCEMIVPGSRAH